MHHFRLDRQRNPKRLGYLHYGVKTRLRAGRERLVEAFTSKFGIFGKPPLFAYHPEGGMLDNNVIAAARPSTKRKQANVLRYSFSIMIATTVNIEAQVAI